MTALRQAAPEPVPDSKHATIAEWWADKQLESSLPEAMTFKPLTNETIMAMWPAPVLALTALDFARAIEQKVLDNLK